MPLELFFDITVEMKQNFEILRRYFVTTSLLVQIDLPLSIGC